MTDLKTEALRKAAETFADLGALFRIRGEKKLAAALGLAERSAHQAMGDSPPELVECLELETNDSTLPKPGPALVSLKLRGPN